MLSDYHRGYLEGIIDGEGSLTVRKISAKGYRAKFQFAPMCFVSNTDLKLLENIQKIVGGGSIVIHNTYENKNWKPCWRYTMPRGKMREILPQLRLVARERQRKLVIQALSIVNGHKGLGNSLKPKNTAKLDVIVRSLRSLNRRGQSHKFDV